MNINFEDDNCVFGFTTFFFRIWPIATGLAFFVSLHAFRPYEIAFPMPTGKKLWNSCRETQLDSTEWKKPQVETETFYCFTLRL